MKQMIIKSKLKDQEALDLLKKISDKLIADKVLDKDDELVVNFEENNGELTIELNADRLTKDNIKSVVADLKKLGKLAPTSEKLFEDSFEESQEAKEADKESEEKAKESIDKIAEKKTDTVVAQKVLPAVELKSQQELLFDLSDNKNNTEMNLETILFSDDELKEKAPEKNYVLAECPKGNKYLMTADEFNSKNAECGGKLKFMCAGSGDGFKEEMTKLHDCKDLKEFSIDEPKEDPKPEEKPKEEPKDAPKDNEKEDDEEVKKQIMLACTDQNMRTFDNLVKIIEEKSKDPEAFKRAHLSNLMKELNINPEPKKEDAQLKNFDELLFDAAELEEKNVETLLFDEVEDKDDEEKSEKEKEDSEGDKPKEDPKPEEKPKEEPEKKESKDDMIRRLNKKNLDQTLEGKAKKSIGKIH